MQVKRIAECCKGSILQYFRHSLSYHLWLRYFFSIFECPFYTDFTVIFPFDFRMLKTTLSFTINSVRVNIDDKKARCLTVMGEVE